MIGFGLENGENSSSSSSSNGGRDGAASDDPGREGMATAALTGVALREVRTRGGATARLDDVRVSELGGIFVAQTSCVGVLGVEPSDICLTGLNSFALRKRGLLKGDEDGLAAATLSTLACCRVGEEVGDAVML